MSSGQPMTDHALCITDHSVVCVIGLGYVGLPLAEAFAKSLKVIGFDTDTQKVSQLISRQSTVISHQSHPSTPDSRLSTPDSRLPPAPYPLCATP